jgi:hypothetical protein
MAKAPTGIAGLDEATRARNWTKNLIEKLTCKVQAGSFSQQPAASSQQPAASTPLRQRLKQFVADWR